MALPQSKVIGPGFESPIDKHYSAKKHGVPNFLGARIPVKSRLNVSALDVMLENYWDEQLIELRHGFPLDFNRKSVLISNMRNHASGLQFPCDVDACLFKECS